MKLHLWGTDFRRSSSEFRAKLFIPSETRESVLRSLLGAGFRDLVYLATCNRVEFYTTAADSFRGTRSQWVNLLARLGLSEEAYYQGYHLEGKSALRHLMRVASSLESLVIGETQILGQLKEAVKWNQEHAFPMEAALERVFAFSFQVAKRIRTETAIGEKPVSVATLGLHHLQRLEADHPLTRAVVVGRSPISVLVVDWLLENRPNCRIVWVNRSLEALERIPQSARTERVSLQAFLENPPDFSHLFTSTGSTEPVFRAGFFRRLPDAPHLFFDFAQPADIEPCPEAEARGRLLRLEDFAREAGENSRERERAVERADALIDEALASFCREVKESPLLRGFSAGEMRLLEGLSSELAGVEREFPEALRPQLRKWAEKLVRKNWHRSREHLRDVLRQLTDPEERVPLV